MKLMFKNKNEVPIDAIVESEPFFKKSIRRLSIKIPGTLLEGSVKLTWI